MSVINRLEYGSVLKRGDAGFVRASQVMAASVEEVFPCLIYFLCAGRNAWHATWQNRYSTNCMHTTKVSAESQAEKSRVQGTVFMIEEQPAIALQSKAGFVIATQINTNTPFSDYSADAIRPASIASYNEARPLLDNYLVPGARVSGVVSSFHASSRFWEQSPPSANSVILLASEDPNLKLERLHDRPLKKWTSESQGSLFSLGWYPVVSSTIASSVIELSSLT